jgi:hypothetical protein
MKCEYCQTVNISEAETYTERDICTCTHGSTGKVLYGAHIICCDCFEYLNTFCELEEALAAAKAENIKIEAKLELAKVLMETMTSGILTLAERGNP